MDTQDKALVSVIICLYNVSSFLREKKLSCILQQTYKNLEIILVDDGSTDDTYLLCEKLRNIDKRITLVKKENGGLGTARNAGLDNATGAYVWFYDVDDEADLQLIEKNVHWMEVYKSDMNIFGYHCITPALSLSENVSFTERKIHENQQLKSVFIDELLFVPNGNGFAWNKFYRRSFIEKYGFRFGCQRIQQDEVFNLQFYPFLDNVYISSELLYTYYIYSSGNNRSRYIHDRINIYISIYNQFKTFIAQWDLSDKRLEKYVYDRLYAGMETSVLFNTFHPDSKKSRSEKKKEILDILNRPEVRKSMEFKRLFPMGIEQKLFYCAYKDESFIRIVFLRMLFSSLRNLKNFCLKRHFIF